jgi:pimeloyl-ACP methyl ester carboxylesterase
VTPLVLVHGGGLDSRQWELVLPFLDGPAIAVDLPGRGTHPADLEAVTFADCADSVADDVDGAGFDEVVLVGHSLAGCSMPSIVERLGPRVRHAVFVACTVPEKGMSSTETLDPEVQARIERGDPDLMSFVFGTDLTDEQVAWCAERVVAEAVHLATDPVDPTPLRAVRSTWIRTLGDLVVPAEKQLRFAANVGECPVIDLDAGHMCMVAQPEATAALLNEVAAAA